jgi:hypothetical protein
VSGPFLGEPSCDARLCQIIGPECRASVQRAIVVLSLKLAKWLRGVEAMSNSKRNREGAKPKRKLTAAERRARRQRQQNSVTIFINGKQKRVPRPQLVQGLPVEEFIARNADPIWLYQNELWEFITPDDET